MVTSTSDTGYHATVRELPNEERPRERLERYGAASLTNSELLAIILRVGIQGENVIELSSRLLRKYGGLGGLLGADLDVLRAERGLGSAKAITLKAALELVFAVDIRRWQGYSFGIRSMSHRALEPPRQWSPPDRLDFEPFPDRAASSVPSTSSS